jgi:hypothetical protein
MRRRVMLIVAVVGVVVVRQWRLARSERELGFAPSEQVRA